MSGSQVTFRRALAADVPAIVDLLADDALGAAREKPGLPLDRRYADAFAAIDRDPNQLLAVVSDGNGIIGCLQISFIPGLSRLGLWRGQIESVRIAASHRGGGLGRRMFEWAIEQCRARGCGLVQLTSDKSRADALRFYDGLGFKASHEGLKLEL
ncbi:acetyltransferase [Alsobacter metallidurans]|uniref:Acetyltransferase n=1 Tax=Alsobacter metallidurans TaxID=340221 RepID=A0A917I9X7_9HYPH|nr:GNAT family N-acetyltransferase [Alsobacter metallidurans]GGH26158.1 acetyltransferase [Alsobacter metallidurans]